MTTPVKQKTWTITSNNRITFVSVADTLAKYLFGMKNFLVANGYTVKGSSNGTTAAMDGVDRWVTSADAQTHATSATAAQSWIVLQDSNPVDICIANFNSVDVSQACAGVSQSQSYVLAGTPTFKPTAVDEFGGGAGGSIGNFGVGSAVSGDRIWNGWVDSTKKLFRSNVFSGSTFVGKHWGVELIDTRVAAGPIAFSPAVWLISTSSNAIPNGTNGGWTRVLAASIHTGNATTNQVYFVVEWFGLSAAAFTTVQPELQGSDGYPAFPLGVALNSNGDGLGHFVGGNGKLGMLYDWWTGKTNAVPGDTYASKTFIAVDGVIGGVGNFGGVWPWDGSTPVIV